MSSELKIRKYRDRYRKIYGYQRLEPETRSFLDTNGEIKTIDINTISHHYDHNLIPAFDEAAATEVGIIEYEEDLIFNTNQSVKSISFGITFSNPPIVTLDLYNDDDNITLYVISVSTTGMIIGTSAPTNATIRYKAANLTSGGYPGIVERRPLFVGTYAIASAKQTTFSSTSEGTLTYSSAGASPEFVATPYDSSNNGQVDVDVFYETITPTSTFVNLSAPILGTINSIAIVNA